VAGHGGAYLIRRPALAGEHTHLLGEHRFGEQQVAGMLALPSRQIKIGQRQPQLQPITERHLERFPAGLRERSFRERHGVVQPTVTPQPGSVNDRNRWRLVPWWRRHE
jgi:hypothetical protein